VIVYTIVVEIVNVVVSPSAGDAVVVGVEIWVSVTGQTVV
jgi:hypothetical protein